MPDWDAEVAVDEALVRELVDDQFPELDASSARLLGEGWDNAVWVVEEAWAFRFPRRQIAIPGVERELGVLPQLGPLVQVPIPVPVFIGQRSERFPCRSSEPGCFQATRLPMRSSTTRPGSRLA